MRWIDYFGVIMRKMAGELGAQIRSELVRSQYRALNVKPQLGWGFCVRVRSLMFVFALHLGSVLCCVPGSPCYALVNPPGRMRVLGCEMKRRSGSRIDALPQLLHSLRSLRSLHSLHSLHSLWSLYSLRSPYSLRFRHCLRSPHLPHLLCSLQYSTSCASPHRRRVALLPQGRLKDLHHVLTGQRGLSASLVVTAVHWQCAFFFIRVAREVGRRLTKSGHSRTFIR